DCPIIFFCRNNGYAISTPTSEQYGGDGIAGKGAGYGLHTIRVDGNDVFAVYNATKAARELALKNKPVLIESMTYRLGHHSTSDDSTISRRGAGVGPIKITQSSGSNTISQKRLVERRRREECRKRILKAFGEAEKEKWSHYHDMFEDVYSEMPKHVKRQRDEFDAFMNEYKQHYPMDRCLPKSA
ncbi:2-oxoisovalerate dehydrogenase subunit alpha, domain protein, partial [Cooperia oncophora]